jgi:RHS repeat-associated protein
MELNAAGATAARYTLAPFGYGDLVSQRRWGVSSFYHFDALGTTRRVTAADESTQLTYVRDAFGVGIASTGTTTNRFRYLGKLGYVQEDTLAGALLRRRYYQYEIGRFVSRDPVYEVGVSEYGYVRNRAAAVSDPSGRHQEGNIIGGLLLGAFIGAGEGRLTCCDEEGRYHTVVYEKFCLGIGTGGSIGIGGAWMPQDGCPDKWTGGAFLECSLGVPAFGPVALEPAIGVWPPGSTGSFGVGIGFGWSCAVCGYAVENDVASAPRDPRCGPYEYRDFPRIPPEVLDRYPPTNYDPSRVEWHA